MFDTLRDENSTLTFQLRAARQTIRRLHTNPQIEIDLDNQRHPAPELLDSCRPEAGVLHALFSLRKCLVSNLREIMLLQHHLHAHLLDVKQEVLITVHMSLMEFLRTSFLDLLFQHNSVPRSLLLGRSVEHNSVVQGNFSV